MSEPLEMWTVYDHPRDDPAHYVARKWLIYPGRAVATDECMRSTELSVLRENLTEKELCALARAPTDDPVIVETWL